MRVSKKSSVEQSKLENSCCQIVRRTICIKQKPPCLNFKSCRMVWFGMNFYNTVGSLKNAAHKRSCKSYKKQYLF